MTERNTKKRPVGASNNSRPKVHEDPVNSGIRQTGFTKSWRAPSEELKYSNLEDGVLIDRRDIAGKNPLSKEFIVAVVIYECNQKNENCCFTRLVEILSEKVNKTMIKRAVDTLLDWKIIAFEYGETDKIRAVKLYKINPSSELLIGELWKNYWNITPIAE